MSQVETATQYLKDRKQKLVEEIDWIDLCLDALKSAEKISK